MVLLPGDFQASLHGTDISKCRALRIKKKVRVQGCEADHTTAGESPATASRLVQPFVSVLLFPEGPPALNTSCHLVAEIAGRASREPMAVVVLSD
ncbi:MAG: hypothetical protein V1792_03305 [Pseudomonadota bacterium]